MHMHVHMHMHMHMHMHTHTHMQAEVESAKQACADLDRAHAVTREVGRDLEAQGALLEFLAELSAAAEARASDGGVTELQPKQYAALVHDLDPSRTQEHTQQLVDWGFGVVAPGGELRDDLAIAPAAFVANLCRTAGAIEAGGGRRRLRSVLRVAKLAIGPTTPSAGAQPAVGAVEPAG